VILLISATRGRGHGAERMLVSLLEAWPNAARTFVLMAPRDAQVFQVARRLGIATTPLDVPGSVLGNLARLVRALRDAPPCQVVHGWTAITFELAAEVARRRRVACTVTLHDHPQASYFSVPRHWLLRLASSRAQGIVCVSEAVADACRRFGYTAPLRVIHNGLADPSPAPAPRSSSSSALRVGFLGMEHEHKGFALVRDWAARLPPGVSFHLYGRVSPEARDAVEALGASGRAVYRGERAPETIFGELDLVVHPSLAFDSFPTVLLETARAGLPAVASNVGGAREIVEDGVTGWLFEPDVPAQGLARLQQLVADRVARQAMGAAARGRFLRELTIGRMIDDYRALWDAV
jgi:glycosyltransferase involved in cell wall biosynthesis